MELEGCKRAFENIECQDKLNINTFVSDRHRGVAKWVRTTHKSTKHYFDIWHKAKVRASKEKGCELLKEWSKSVRNHLYWCVTSSQAGFSELIKAKWVSFMRHVNNEHKGHPSDLYPECNHEELTDRKWIKVGK